MQESDRCSPSPVPSAPSCGIPRMNGCPLAGNGRTERAAPRGRPSFFHRSMTQFRLRSTILPLEIQGIMARSFSPTFSIWCSSLMRRVALKDG